MAEVSNSTVKIISLNWLIFLTVPNNIYSANINPEWGKEMGLAI